MQFFTWSIVYALLNIKWGSVTGTHISCQYEFKDDLRYDLQNKFFPWSVVVMTRNNSSTEKSIFMGTLISQSAVLTTAIDIIDLMGTDQELEVYLSSDSTQKFKVIKSIPMDWYNRNENNLGILVLDSQVKTNIRVFPACIDYVPVVSTLEMGYGEVLLWTYNLADIDNKVLEIIPVETLPAERCRDKNEPLDKSKPYCVKIPKRDGKLVLSFPKYGNRGAALVIKYFNKYYVKAIWSGKTGETSKYWSFSDLQPHIKWMTETLKNYTPEY